MLGGFRHAFNGLSIKAQKREIRDFAFTVYQHKGCEVWLLTYSAFLLNTLVTTFFYFLLIWFCFLLLKVETYYRVMIGTWNVAGRVPHDDLDVEEWLSTEDSADMYIIGLVFFFPLNVLNFGTHLSAKR